MKFWYHNQNTDSSDIFSSQSECITDLQKRAESGKYEIHWFTINRKSINKELIIRLLTKGGYAEETGLIQIEVK